MVSAERDLEVGPVSSLKRKPASFLHRAVAMELLDR